VGADTRDRDVRTEPARNSFWHSAWNLRAVGAPEQGYKADIQGRLMKLLVTSFLHAPRVTRSIR